jgi:hypothetical protein
VSAQLVKWAQINEPPLPAVGWDPTAKNAFSRTPSVYKPPPTLTLSPTTTPAPHPPCPPAPPSLPQLLLRSSSAPPDSAAVSGVAMPPGVADNPDGGGGGAPAAQLSRLLVGGAPAPRPAAASSTPPTVLPRGRLPGLRLLLRRRRRPHLSQEAGPLRRAATCPSGGSGSRSLASRGRPI